MLTHLLIRNFAIIDELDLSLGPGMTALTGETGAGKSILVDAIGLLLGDRADSTAVRVGREKAEINLILDLGNLPKVHDWLDRHGLASNAECALRRVITRDGRSRAYINGTPSTLQMLRELGELTISIHGQRAHQALGRSGYQRDILDLQAGLQGELATLQTAYHNWRHLLGQRQNLHLDDPNRQTHIDFLKFQVDELHAATPEPDEFVGLVERHKRVTHAQESLEGIERARILLYEGEPDVDSLLNQAISSLQTISTFESGVWDILTCLQNTHIEIKEAVDDLRHMMDAIEVSPEQLALLEGRLQTLHELGRKHHCDPNDLPVRQAELEAELSTFQNVEMEYSHLDELLAQAADTYRKLARRIHEMRTEMAQTLAEGITRRMQTLGMEGGHLIIDVTMNHDAQPTPYGLDRVEFKVSANPGQPPLPLGKVASGGELSRISLAIQMAANQDHRIPVLIFDEVDAGIGGAVAEVVGRTLRTLGRHHQILCVTHLPQVAAQAHQHLKVSKLKQKDSTQTRIQTLSNSDRVEELARMLGGVKLTRQTLVHAKEMLHLAQED